MPALVPPHGGLAEPVCRSVPAGEMGDFLAHAETLTKMPVSDADLLTVYRLGDGGLSPLVGPMDSATYNRVLDEAVIEHNGKLYAWTIPIALPVEAELAGRLKAGQEVALVNTDGRIVATLKLSDIYPWDKLRYLRSVYLTERTDHPGGDMVLVGDAGKTHLVGGTIRVLPQPKHRGSASMCSRRARCACCWPPRAGSAWSPSRRETPCTAPMNTPWSTAWRRCCGRGTTPGPV